MNNKKKTIVAGGFTLIETIIVLGIIMVLTGVVGYSSASLIERAKKTAAKGQIAIFTSALNMYQLDTGVLPSNEQGLAALWEKPTLTPQPHGWEGPYTQDPIPKDPWGDDYIYYSPGRNGLAFTIISKKLESLE